jgi:hypothetical protein
MKKYLFVPAFLLFSIASNAQVIMSILLGDKLNSGKVEFGLEGGFNWSTLKNLNGAKNLRSFNLGFYFDIKMFKDSAWMLNTGVIVKSPMGAGGLPVYSLNNAPLDSAFAGGIVNRKVRYFNVPLMMKYQFKNHIYAKAGVQLGLRAKAYDQFLKTVKDQDDLEYTLKTKDDYHPLDAGLAVGLGYRLMKGNGMNIGVQYYFGFVDVVVDDSSPSQFNRSFYLTAGIPIGKNKTTTAKEPGQ